MTDETRYNNRQIERMFDQQSTEIKEYFDSTMKPFAEQLALTARDVTELKLTKAQQAGFNRATIFYGGILISMALGLGGWALLEVANIGEIVHSQVQSTIQESLGAEQSQSYQTNK